MTKKWANMRCAPPQLIFLPKLLAAQLALNLLAILVGVMMLVSSLIPVYFFGVILAVNGCLLLCLVHLLIIAEAMEGRIPVDLPRLQPALSGN